MKILVVEDEVKLNKGLVQLLQSKGYAVDSALDGEEGEKIATWGDYDLLLLDVMLPKRDGFEVCMNLRRKNRSMPVLFLTAKDEINDKLEGFSAGGDDYLVKPFSTEELVARVRALLKRPKAALGDTLVLDNLKLDTKAQTLHIGNEEIALTLREYGMLEYFLRNPNTVITRDDLIAHVWDRNYDSFSNVVDVHLKNLRKKLPKSYAKRIQTVWGKGYRLV